VDGAGAAGDEGVGVGAAPAHAVALQAAVDDERHLPFDEAAADRLAGIAPGAVIAEPVALGGAVGERRLQGGDVARIARCPAATISSAPASIVPRAGRSTVLDTGICTSGRHHPHPVLGGTPLLAAVLCQRSDLDVLVVDDNSPDGTGALAQHIAEAEPRVHVHRRLGKQGLGTAYLDGFRFALAHDYGAICQMDADFSHDPASLPRLLDALDSADVAIGSRWAPGGGTVGWPRSRQLISRGGSLYARLVLGVPVTDMTGGFKAFRREALEHLDLAALRATGFGFQVEMNVACARAGLRIIEVPIIFSDRVRGQSKMSSRIFVEALLLVPRLRLRRTWAIPARAASITPPAVQGEGQRA